MRFHLPVLSALLLSAACSGKGAEESPLTDSGKDDSFRSPTENGQLSFTESNSATLDFETQFHSWTFEVSATSDISIRTVIDELEETPDTVLYVYHRASTDDPWGRHIEKNDDDGDSLASRIDFTAAPGLYRIKVKGFTLAENGPFDVEASCAGDGCLSEDAGAIEMLVSTEEFSAADFDCGDVDEELDAFDASPDYVFFRRDGDVVVADFGFRREQTAHATTVVPEADGATFTSAAVESEDMPGVSLTISGRTRALSPNELIEADQTPIAVIVEYQYDLGNGETTSCEVELIAGLRF